MAYVQMLLAAREALVVATPLARPIHGLRTFRVSRKQLRVCIARLRMNDRIVIRPLNSSDDRERAVVVSRKATEDSEVECVAAVSCDEFRALRGQVQHVDVMSRDASGVEFARSRAATRVRSLDLSRLDIDDDWLAGMVEGLRFRNLGWVDLSGNPRVTRTGVEAVAAAVERGGLPSLWWLELAGTEWDATPYVDGFSWRMSERARQMANRYGHQRWMMLGSRLPQLENAEVLVKTERELPPSRFSQL